MRLAPLALVLALSPLLGCQQEAAPVDESQEQAFSFTTTLAYAQHRPTALLVDATHVYWWARSPSSDTPPFVQRVDVLRVAKTGGLREVLATDQSGLVAFALDDTSVYWLNQSTDCGSANGAARRVAKTGGPIEDLATQLPCGAPSVNTQMVVDGASIYFSGDGGVHALPKNGGPSSLVATAGPNPHASIDSTVLLREDAATLYWGDSYGPLWAQPKSGGAKTKLLEKSPWTAAIDASFLYWVDDAKVWRVAKTGGAPEAIGPAGLDNAAAIAVDDQHVYYSGGTARTIRRLAKAGAPSSTLFASGDKAHALALDATSVFFPSYGIEYTSFMAPQYVSQSGSIRRRTKE